MPDIQRTLSSAATPLSKSTLQSPKQAALDAARTALLEINLPLKDTAKNLVYGKGNPEAKLMFIGEAPGEQEDIQGIPFVGAAGKQLDKLLNTIGLTLEQVYIADILKYRPPGNRNPNDEEIKTHTPYLVEQITIIQPTVIATLGNFSTKFVLAHFNPDNMKSIGGISFLHGKPVDMTIDGRAFTVMPLYHPAAILYKPTLRQELEQDFQKIKILL